LTTGDRRWLPLLALAAACTLVGPTGGSAAPSARAVTVLAVSKTGTGTGRVTSLPAGIDCGSTCSAGFTDGSTVTLIANADSSSSFSGWGGACSGSSATCQVVMNAPQSVTATFTAILPPPTGPPTTGHDVDVTPVAGTVLVKIPGKKTFVSLKRLSEIPVGSHVDTTRGTVRLVSALRKGKLNHANFYNGLFQIRQQRRAGAVTELDLEGVACPKAGFQTQSLHARRRRRLWGSGKGRFSTKGRYSSATVRGTKWLVEDRCDGTLTRVVHGVVTVRDFVKKKTVFVRAGQTYFARAPR
jgi:Divergent InlB B-repeat domain